MRQTGSGTETERRNRQTGTGIETEKTGTETNIHTSNPTSSLYKRSSIYLSKDNQTDGQTGRETERQLDRQTGTET